MNLAWPPLPTSPPPPEKPTICVAHSIQMARDFVSPLLLLLPPWGSWWSCWSCWSCWGCWVAAAAADSRFEAIERRLQVRLWLQLDVEIFAAFFSVCVLFLFVWRDDLEPLILAKWLCVLAKWLSCQHVSEHESVTQFQLLLAALVGALYLSSQHWPLKVEAQSQLQ